MNNYLPINLTTQMKQANSLKDTNGSNSLKKKIDNLNSPVSIKVIQNLVNLPTKKNLGTDGFTRDFYQTFKGNVTQFLHKLFQKIYEEQFLTHSMSPRLS